MKAIRFCTLLALPLVLAACGGEDEIDDAPVLEEPIEAPAIEPAPAATPMATPVTLQPVNDSGITGDITLAEEGTGTRITAHLMGLDSGAEILGHVHRGTCESMASGLNALGEFGPTAVGADGTLTATVPVTMTDLNSGQYAIAFHRGEADQHIACADFAGMM